MPQRLPDPHATTGPAPLKLRILATSDLHAQLLSYDYDANRRQFGRGLAQTASLIAQARAECPNLILLDNGDFLQGSALSEIAALPGRRRPHPAITAFNLLRYDAVAIGNHELDYGLPLLKAAMDAANFPMLSANLARALGATPLQDQHFAPPYALIDRQLTDASGRQHLLRIGVLGLTPPQISVWNARQIGNAILTRPMAEAAAAWVPVMRQAGADLVICLAHSGMTAPGSPPDTENCAEVIATLPGIDAVIAGHSHLVWPRAPRIDRPGDGQSAPVVQPGHSGSHLGMLDLRLHPPGPTRKQWHLAEIRSMAVNVSDAISGLPQLSIRRAAAPIRHALAADHRAAMTWLRQPLGHAQVALHSFFAPLVDSQALRLVAAAMCAHARRALANGPCAHLPVLAAVSPYRCGGRSGPMHYTDIAAGPLTIRSVQDLYPFPNTLVALRTTGAALAARLSRAMAVFAPITPGLADQPLLNRAVPTFRFEAIPGLTYDIDLSAPQSRWQHGGPQRIRNLCHRGEPLRPDQPFVLVTNSHLSALHPEGDTRPLLDEGYLCRNLLASHIRRTQVIDADHAPGWRLLSQPGTSVIYDSGLGALQHLADIARFRPEPLGLTAEGFQRFRLHL